MLSVGAYCAGKKLIKVMSVIKRSTEMVVKDMTFFMCFLHYIVKKIMILIQTILPHREVVDR